MKTSIQGIAFSLLTIAIGLAWWLNTMDVIPGVNWVWTVGLGITGVLILAVGGVNKVTIITGPFLIIASVFSVMRQTGAINVDQEVPILVVVFGVLTLLAQIPGVPPPRWMRNKTSD